MRNRRLRAAPRRIRRVGRVRGEGRGAAAARWARERGRVLHRLRRRVRRHVLSVLRPGVRAVVDLLGGQPASGAARPAGDRLVRGRHGHLRGRGHVRRAADPRALHLVGRHDADAALGAGLLGRRRGDVGDELDHGLHARPERRHERARARRRVGRLPPRREGRPRRSRASRSTARSSSGTTSRRTTLPCRSRCGARATQSARRVEVGRARRPRASSGS